MAKTVSLEMMDRLKVAGFRRYMYPLTLSDLLEWMKEQKFARISLEYSTEYEEDAWALSLWKSDIQCIGSFEADTPEDAAALACEWVLKEGK